jgi:hypothetical protein
MPRSSSRLGCGPRSAKRRGTIHGFAGYRRLVPSAQDDLVGALASARTMIQDLALGRATAQCTQRAYQNRSGAAAGNRAAALGDADVAKATSVAH